VALAARVADRGVCSSNRFDAVAGMWSPLSAELEMRTTRMFRAMFPLFVAMFILAAHVEASSAQVPADCLTTQRQLSGVLVGTGKESAVVAIPADVDPVIPDSARPTLWLSGVSQDIPATFSAAPAGKRQVTLAVNRAIHRVGQYVLALTWTAQGKLVSQCWRVDVFSPPVRIVRALFWGTDGTWHDRLTQDMQTASGASGFIELIGVNLWASQSMTLPTGWPIIDNTTPKSFNTSILDHLDTLSATVAYGGAAAAHGGHVLLSITRNDGAQGTTSYQLVAEGPAPILVRTTDLAKLGNPSQVITLTGSNFADPTASAVLWTKGAPTTVSGLPLSKNDDTAGSQSAGITLSGNWTAVDSVRVALTNADGQSASIRVPVDASPITPIKRIVVLNSSDSSHIFLGPAVSQDLRFVSAKNSFDPAVPMTLQIGSARIDALEVESDSTFIARRVSLVDPLSNACSLGGGEDKPRLTATVSIGPRSASGSFAAIRRPCIDAPIPAVFPGTTRRVVLRGKYLDGLTLGDNEYIVIKSLNVQPDSRSAVALIEGLGTVSVAQTVSVLRYGVQLDTVQVPIAPRADIAGRVMITFTDDGQGCVTEAFTPSPAHLRNPATNKGNACITIKLPPEFGPTDLDTVVVSITQHGRAVGTSSQSILGVNSDPTLPVPLADLDEGSPVTITITRQGNPAAHWDAPVRITKRVGLFTALTATSYSFGNDAAGQKALEQHVATIPSAQVGVWGTLSATSKAVRVFVSMLQYQRKFCGQTTTSQFAVGVGVSYHDYLVAGFGKPVDEADIPDGCTNATAPKVRSGGTLFFFIGAGLALTI
jgi:hypothetical protein